MNAQEYENAKKEMPSQILLLRKYSAIAPKFNQELQKFIYTLITVKGHALCMDVKSERNKISKIISRAISDLLMEYEN